MVIRFTNYIIWYFSVLWVTFPRGLFCAVLSGFCVSGLVLCAPIWVLGDLPGPPDVDETGHVYRLFSQTVSPVPGTSHSWYS